MANQSPPLKLFLFSLDLFLVFVQFSFVESSPSSLLPNPSLSNVEVCSIVNENSNLTLTCPLTYYIGSIDFASFGFPYNRVCGYLQYGSCNSGNSFSVVSEACLHQTTCTVLASDSVFGDPCFGTVKVLAVSATCVPIPTQFCDTESERSIVNLQCAGEGYTIQEINFASYGVPDSTVCGAEAIGECDATNSVSVVQGLCLNQPNCSVDVSDSQFYDPCEGIVKSLTVRATCAPLITVCDTVKEHATNNTLVLEPPYPNYVIETIDFASYGVLNSTTCGQEQVGTCNSTNSMSVVTDNCLYQPTCSLQASNNFFGGDPCVYIQKELTVRVGYSGVPLTLCSTVSENNNLNLQCAPGYNIYSIDFASFGSLNSTICGQEQVGTCDSPYSMSVVTSNCLGKNSCSVNASNNFFGADPCYGTVKELTVRASCLLQNQICETIPEWSSMRLTCPSGYIISTINFASFGVPSSTKCGAEQLGNCHSQNSLDVVSQVCLYQNTCLLQSTIYYFSGDPCVNVKKELSVRVTCSPN